MHIFVGPLPENATNDTLRAMFAEFGEVRSAEVVVDKKTGVSQGYGFIEMPVKSEARKAMDGLRTKDLGAGPLRVRALKPGDEFHHNAVTKGNSGLQGGGKSAYQGEPGPVGAGAIRRGGKRGS
jgi:RNA recognition motif-containing protein